MTVDYGTQREKLVQLDGPSFRWHCDVDQRIIGLSLVGFNRRIQIWALGENCRVGEYWGDSTRAWQWQYIVGLRTTGLDTDQYPTR